MSSLIGGLFMVIFVVVFGMTFVSAIFGFWRMRGMTNKIFSLAERELERKLQEDPFATPVTSVAGPGSMSCSHCGSRVVADVAQCPSCGAGLQGP